MYPSKRLAEWLTYNRLKQDSYSLSSSLLPKNARAHKNGTGREEEKVKPRYQFLNSCFYNPQLAQFGVKRYLMQLVFQQSRSKELCFLLLPLGQPDGKEA